MGGVGGILKFFLLHFTQEFFVKVELERFLNLCTGVGYDSCRFHVICSEFAEMFEEGLVFLVGLELDLPQFIRIIPLSRQSLFDNYRLRYFEVETQRLITQLLNTNFYVLKLRRIFRSLFISHQMLVWLLMVRLHHILCHLVKVI